MMMGVQRSAAAQTAQANATPGQEASMAPAAQAGGAAVTQAQGKNAAAVQDQQAKNVQGLAQQSLQAQAADAQHQSSVRGQDIQGVQTAGAHAASVLSREQQKDLVDRQMIMDKDARGRLVLNAQQLQDYAILHATNANDLNAKKAIMDQAFQQKQEIMKVALQKIDLQYKYEVEKAQQTGNHQTVKYLAELKAQAEEKMRKDAADQKNKMQMWSTGLGIVGAVVGGVLTIEAGGVGAAAGYQAGSAAGAGIASSGAV